MGTIRRLTGLFGIRKGGTAASSPVVGDERCPPPPSTLTPQLSETVCLKDGREALIRRVEPSDAPLLYEHMMSMSEETRRLFCPYPFDRAQAEAIAATARCEQHFRLLALVGEKCSGYAYFSTRNARKGLPMVSIGITDEFQGVGLGRALMNVLITNAKAREFKGLDLTVFKHNYRAQRLYASLGFVFTGEADGGRQYSMRLYFGEMKPAA